MVKIWQPPSFDPPRMMEMQAPPPLPTVQEIESIRSDAYIEAFAEGKGEGYQAGHAQGHAEGVEQGLKAGHERAYNEARAQIEQLNQTLQTVLEHLRDLPAAIEEPLAELAWMVGQRLSGHEGLARGPFVQAVQEALMRLPRPGETLFMRVREDEARVWKALIDDPGLPFRCTLLVDADVLPGHAYVEVDGARLDLGSAARHALVRMALGLGLNQDDATRRPVSDGAGHDFSPEAGEAGAATGEALHTAASDVPEPPAKKARASRKAAGTATGKVARAADKATSKAAPEKAADPVERPAKRSRK